MQPHGETSARHSTYHQPEHAQFGACCVTYGKPRCGQDTDHLSDLNGVTAVVLRVEVLVAGLQC